MELNWSLKEIYPSFDGDEFKQDLNKLTNIIEEINKWALEATKNKDNLVEKLEDYINKFTKVTDLSSRISIFINLSLSVNTKDKNALRYSDILEKKLTNLIGSSVKFERYISSIEGLDEIISKSKLLKEHEFMLKNIVEQSQYLLSDKEESIIANMKNTGSNAWAKLKDNLISTLLVEIEEDNEIKHMPLTMVLNMAYDKDATVRKKAYEAEIKSYKKVEEGVAAALNGIKGEVLTVCDFRGYKSPLEKTLIDSRMSEESLEAMFLAMKESLPVFRKYLRRKGEMLGHKNGLPFYDLYAPVCEADMKFTYEEGTKFVEKNFRTFSDNLGDFARKAIDNHWIDVKPKEGKVGGAFCENLHFNGESRILLNYGDNFGDVVTLAHELGHGFHGECLNNETTLNSDYPMPIAETASTFCETIIKKAAIKDASKNEALAILETEISDCTQVIVDIYSRFLFEKSFFEARKGSSLSVEEINDLMLDAQREAYGDGLDPDFLHPYMWTWKPHYYDAEYNYYNFPYAFGLLFAKGLYAEYLKKGKTFSKEYEKLLSITGKNKIADVARVMGIDINDTEFWRNSLKTIEEDIEEFIDLSNK
ncbi:MULTISPECIES: M3 family oligoendopeptidase [Clostridium]|jgi:pepF/M3 family oligoendopeptidase|uniref:M3 family oligoendopeptidase n=2 Tax=Clostridium beijerinckii TaxID=1520 RepID=A0AB74VIA6_CLOBE|nr:MULTISPECIES: M3 family oligoendopeptidase [Clostridium]AVK49825.1 oligoendopeptidase F [Clostridium sp. MF28]MBC2457934.1 M3 family oligoendopeptidase [Clostridium beijerinckii]MBC2475204.1 M3 family oligoendopeptidase [Clostridium beijerinckii]MCI1477415.1 M3 family oligoendopeptidase [Clostridium beijerinckii]MCI1576964.1 M3 family oligoendopeptidase [Clostridium beijerinckii]